MPTEPFITRILGHIEQFSLTLLNLLELELELPLDLTLLETLGSKFPLCISILCVIVGYIMAKTKIEIPSPEIQAYS